MKQVLFLFFLFIGICTKAQHHAFTDSNNVWYISKSWQDVSSFESGASGFSAFFKGDTLVNDSVFRALWHRLESSSSSGPGGNHDTIYNNETPFFAGWYYEDTLQQTFYSATFKNDHAELKLLWDFSLQKGDTLFQEVQKTI